MRQNIIKLKKLIIALILHSKHFWNWENVITMWYLQMEILILSYLIQLNALALLAISRGTSPHQGLLPDKYAKRNLLSISSTLSARNFRTKFWRQKFQTQNTAFVQNFGAQNVLSYKKCICKMLMKFPIP